MKRKLLSILLTFCLAFSLLPTAALAVETEQGGDTTTDVAQIGETKYDSLQTAFNNAKSKTVKLLANVKGNFTISQYNTTLDLNGFTINGGTATGKPTLTITARVTVKDSSATQTGTIMREDTAENSGVSSHYVIDVQDGWLTFESGTVKNGSGAGGTKGASLVRVGNDSVAKYPGLNIKGGTFTQDNFIVIKVYRGDLFLNGGTLKSANSYAVENRHRATIKGGTVNGNVSSWTYSGGLNSDLTISGGTVNGNVEAVNYDNAADKQARIYVKGGTVNGTLGTYTYSNGLVPTEDTSKATIEVTGGTFSKDPHEYLVEGSSVTRNADGTFGVAKEEAYLAKVGDTSYYTMDEAFHAAVASGETLMLLRNYATNAEQNSGSKSFTIDLNGFTWTYTGTDTNRAAFEINYPDVTLTVKNGTVVSGSMVGLIPSAMGGTIKYDNSGLVLDGVTATANGNSGIETNGNNTNDTVTLKNSTLNVPNGFGIYFPSSGTLTIDNSTINAKTMGVQVCAGSLNINDGSKITVTGDAVPKAENDGAIQDGAAISIVNRTGYKGLGNITVTGGMFKANGNNAAIKAYDWANKTESDFTADKGTVAVTGGLFSSDVTKYCAEGMMAVENKDTTTKTTYPYTIGVVPDAAIDVTITENTQAGKTDGSVSNSVTNKAAAAAVASSVTTNVASTADDIKITDTEKKTAIQQLLADGQIELNENGNVTAPNGSSENVTVTIIKQPYLDVEVTALNSTAKELSLTIEPKYNLLATTDKDDARKSVVVSTGNALTVTGEMEVKLALPDGFAAAGDKLSIKHTKGNGTVEYYTGVVSADGKSVTFTTKGFSPFTISAPAASIGETMYPTLAEAIAKAANGNTVKLEKNCTESVTVSGKSLIINKNDHEYDFDRVTVDSNSTKTENGNTLTITYTAPSSSSGSSGSSYDPTYSVSTPSKTEHGTVTVSPKSASKGDRVTVTVKPDSGYVLETLTVTDKNGNELTLKDKGNGKYTFTMPAGKVEVKATFMEDNSMLNFFYDVPNNAYFYEAVKWAVKNGITTGVGNNLFAPEQPCTRAQIVTFLWRAAGSPEPKGAASGMTDVVSGSYYEKAVAWAIENGITTGTTTSTFSPDATCTRAQAVTFLARALKAKAASAAEFSDVPTDSYFADAVAWAAANGVTEGIGGGLFGSDNDCTRGQIVTFLYRAYNK